MLVTDSRSVSETERGPEESEGAQAFLLRVSEELANSLDYEITLQSIVRQSVPFLADFCLVGRIGPDGRPRPVAAAHVDPAKERRLRELTISSGGESAPQVAQAFRTGEPVIVPELSEALVYAMARDADEPANPRTMAALRDVDPKSAIAMPLIARGRTLGVLSLNRLEGSPPFSPRDVPVIQQLARLCALALDNADLYRAATDAVRVREELLAATSHELRTPLSAIKGFVTTLLRPDTEWDDSIRRDFLEEIDREADRLDALIADLLDMSQLLSGGCQNFQRAMTAPAVLVCRGLDRIRLRLATTTLDIDRGLATLPRVWVESRRIEQVLANLVDNAIKYAPGSVIHISGEVTDDGRTVELRVEDDGPGIDDDDLDHIFDTFYRGRARAQSEVPGTGLGLAIARTIVEGHGGRIRVRKPAHRWSPFQRQSARCLLVRAQQVGTSSRLTTFAQMVRQSPVPHASILINDGFHLYALRLALPRSGSFSVARR